MEQPIKLTSYNANEQDIERKREKIQKEIKILEERLKDEPTLGKCNTI
ncbi:MAG: hypothetical protein ACRC1P_05490 [Cellulosilyticaceae bacterium]